MKQAGFVGASLAIPSTLWQDFLKTKRKFRLSLNPSAIGVNLSQIQMIEVASSLGFEAIVPLPAEVAAMSLGQANTIAGQMSEYELTWDAAGLPVEFRKNEVIFRGGLLRLHEICAALRNVGVTRMSTWIMPTHASLTYRKNFALHVRRIRQMVDILVDYDIRLGLEYVGPKTLMASQRFPFIRTLVELQELISEVARPNLGIQLDSFHWFCAEETKQDILGLDKDLIVTCDLNDAKLGRSVAEQLDWERELPGATGIIDIKGFLEALQTIGYDGPVRAEPFNETLNKMANEPALRETYTAMKKSFDLL